MIELNIKGTWIDDDGIIAGATCIFVGKLGDIILTIIYILSLSVRKKYQNLWHQPSSEWIHNLGVNKERVPKPPTSPPGSLLFGGWGSPLSVIGNDFLDTSQA